MPVRPTEMAKIAFVLLHRASRVSMKMNELEPPVHCRWKITLNFKARSKMQLFTNNGADTPQN